jgi:hypothetical protein
MSTQIVYNDFSNNEITEQQLGMLKCYKKTFIENGELRMTEFWSFGYVQNEVVQSGGFYYLSDNDNLIDIKQKIIGKGKNWTLFYGKVTNTKGDILWNYQVLYDGLLKTYGRIGFDAQMREISSETFSEVLNRYSAKSKMFYGDTSIFPPPYDGAATFTFFYDDDSNAPIEIVSQYGSKTDFDYSINEFLADNEVMALFHWSQHPFFHNFEPMLP